MWTFAVWAPKAKTLGVRVEDRDYAMAPGAGGWWRARVPEAAPGSDYGYLVDGGDPVPDPRSPWQPNGVHGLSRLVDQEAFGWTDSAWQPAPLAAAIVYELHVGTITSRGTFESAIERLTYLKDLGVTHIELMPVNEFSGDWGWGYDGVDLYAPHHAYGGPEGLKRLVNACHLQGLAVLFDVVYNHLGPAGNYLAKFGPYFTKRYSTPWGEAVNLDGEQSAEVRRFFIDNALMWLDDYHADGLRLDAVHALLDSSAIHFLEELSEEVHGLDAKTGKRKVLIAESDLNDPRVVRTPEIGGYGLDAQWSDDFHHALHAAMTGEISGYYQDFGGIEPIAKSLRDTFVYDGIASPHRGRVHGRPARAVSSHRFLGYAQTHDQVGNRARGERLAHLTSINRAKIAAALVFTAPFIPMIFQGEEFAASTPFQYFTHHEDAELANLVSEGRKKEFSAFGWKPEDVPDPQNAETFQRSKLKWAELTQTPHREMFEWYRDWIRLRKSHPDLSRERGNELSVEIGDGYLHLRRGAFHLFCNVSPKSKTIEVERRGRTLLVSGNAVWIGEQSLVLPPDSILALDTADEKERA